MCDVQFVNKLPEVPFEPKFLKCPLDESRHVRYRETTLERDYKLELLSGVDVGVALDLIDYTSFTQKDRKPELNTVDQQLITGSTQTKQTTVIPFLRQFTYLPSEVVSITAPKSNDMPIPTREGNSGTKEHLIEDIKESFLACKTLPVHPDNPALSASAIFPILPDENLWGNEYSEVVSF